MDFAHSSEQELFRRSVREFVDDRLPVSATRALLDDQRGYDSDAWSQLSTQLLLPGLSIPEEYGGTGFSNVEAAIVAFELGRAIASVPYLASIGLAANTVMAAGDAPAKSAFLPQLADGSAIGTVAYEEGPERCLTPFAFATHAQQRSGEWLVTSPELYAVSAHVADFVFLTAQTDDGLALFAVEPTSSGYESAPVTSMDLTRRVERVRLDRVPARRLTPPGDARRDIGVAFDVALSLVANEQAGGASRCLEMATDYAKVRSQFGRPIGSFQAIKHKCADMLVAVESAKVTADYAAWVSSGDHDELPVAAAIAFSTCGDAFARVAADNIQIHGGVGFTWEHDAHLYLRRAKSMQLLFGSPNWHLARLADLTGI